MPAGGSVKLLSCKNPPAPLIFERYPQTGLTTPAHRGHPIYCPLKTLTRTLAAIHYFYCFQRACKWAIPLEKAASLLAQEELGKSEATVRNLRLTVTDGLLCRFKSQAYETWRRIAYFSIPSEQNLQLWQYKSVFALKGNCLPIWGIQSFRRSHPLAVR